MNFFYKTKVNLEHTSLNMCKRKRFIVPVEAPVTCIEERKYKTTISIKFTLYLTSTMTEVESNIRDLSYVTQKPSCNTKLNSDHFL